MALQNATFQALSSGFLLNDEYHGLRYEVITPAYQSTIVRLVRTGESNREMDLTNVTILDINGADITPVTFNEKARVLTSIVSRPSAISDAKGDSVLFTGSRGFAVDMATQPADYDMSVQFVNAYERPPYFFIIPEVEGEVIVELQHAPEGETFTITTAQTESYLGRVMPLRLRKIIKSGTTANVSVIL